MDYLQNHLIFFNIIVTALGLMVGSFCNVVIYRLPIMIKRAWRNECLEFLADELENAPIIQLDEAPKHKTHHAEKKKLGLAFPASHCPNCNHPIPLWLNIPLVSYLMLRGKCRFCHQKISWRYPAVELLTAAATLFVALHFGASTKTALLLLVTWGLLAMTFIDFEHLLLPDTLTMPILWLGLLVNCTGHAFTTPTDAILGAALGYTSLWLIAFAFKLIRKIDGMGHGDFKLLAMFGAWLGASMLPIIACLAALLGAIVGLILVLGLKRDFRKPLPFGPYLAIAGWAMFFYGQAALNLVSRLVFAS